MKWQEISKAKIEFNAPVFTKDKNGNFGLGKLMEKRQTENGIVYGFLLATFNDSEDSVSSEITHVAKPK